MSYQNRPLNSSLRHPSTGGSQSNSGQSPVLLARINEKKVELENLKQLRDLSGGLAAQMQALEEKLSTLSDGTEGEQINGVVRCIPLMMSLWLSGGYGIIKLAQCHASDQHGFKYVSSIS